MEKTCRDCGETKEIGSFPERSPACKSCRAIYQKSYRIKNREKLLANSKIYGKKYYSDNKEHINSKHREHYSKNKEIAAERGKRYRYDNKEYWAAKNKAWVNNNREKALAYGSEWCKRNRAKTKAKGARRRAAKFNATPSWENKESVESIYALSSFLSFATFGDGYHVDHIVPLRSDKVCGLHTEHNLQILRAPDNMSKGNYHWPDMP